MKHHRILNIIIFVLLAFVLFKLGQTFFNNKNVQIEAEQNIKPEEKIVDMSFVTEVPLVSSSKYGTVSGSYPKFRNADPSFNDKIKNAIFIAQSEFENNSKENWNARVKTALPGEKITEFPNNGDFTFSTKIDYIQVNADFISILITASAFSGGAHGYEAMYSFNYNVKLGHEIVMQDLFSNDLKYLTKVSDYSRKDLLSQFQNKIKRADFENDADYKGTLENITNMIIPGTEPTEENFSVFTVSPGFINIYFSQYQVAPYVYGSQTVKMPL
jgi:hypothetical protein